MATTFIATAQTNYYGANGTEYEVIGSLPGDQVFPDMALTTNGGIVVWQDNITDGSSWGISARRLDGTLSGALGIYRVNAEGAESQENPRVAMLKDGGAVFVWQGGKQGFQHIFARYLSATNTWKSGSDLAVSTFSNNFQVNPALTVLNNSNVVVVWSSYNQAGSNTMQDVYAKILSPTGANVTGEFRINQFTNFNQRSPSVAALSTGGFVVTWVSEQQRTVAPNLGANTTATSAGAVVLPSVDVYGRLYTSSGAAAGGEFLINADANPCANPSVAAGSDGGFIATWSARDMVNRDNGWDIYARSFTSAGTGGLVKRVNTYVYGDQYVPRISSLGLDYLVVWTSLAQDGSREGVYAQFLNSSTSPVGGEIRVNGTTVSQQMHPAVAADGASQFAVVWTSFNGSPNNFDLMAQRYLNGTAVLLPMPAPFVWAPFGLTNGVYQPQLQVSWSPLLGIPVASYQVYVDGSATPATTTASNVWVFNTTASSTHSFRVNYITTDGRSPAISPAATGTTWSGGNYYGVPFEWMIAHYGNNFGAWPAAGTKLGGNGPTLNQVFLTGGDPTDSSTWLRTSLEKTSQGFFLNWNTQPGFTYQVETTANLNSWSSLGAPRFAAGTNDSIFVGATSAGYYRVYLLR